MYFDIMFLFCFSLMMLAGRRVAAGVARPLPRAWIQVLPMVFLVKPCLLFPGGASGKEPACQCRRGKGRRFNPWEGEIPWSRKWQPTPVFLLGESHGQRSLVGQHPWGCKELDTTERPSTRSICQAPCKPLKGGSANLPETLEALQTSLRCCFGSKRG